MKDKHGHVVISAGCRKRNSKALLNTKNVFFFCSHLLPILYLVNMFALLTRWIISSGTRLACKKTNRSKQQLWIKEQYISGRTRLDWRTAYQISKMHQKYNQIILSTNVSVAKMEYKNNTMCTCCNEKPEKQFHLILANANTPAV